MSNPNKWISRCHITRSGIWHDELMKIKEAILSTSESMRHDVEKIAEMVARINTASKISGRLVRAIYRHNVKLGMGGIK